MDVKKVSIQTKCALKEVEILLQKRNQMLTKIQLKYSVHIKEEVNFIPFSGLSFLTPCNLNTCTACISH